MVKVVGYLFLCGCLLFMSLTSYNPLDDRASKDRILRLVEDERELLMTCIENEDFSPLDQYDGVIQEVDANENHVDFDCGGVGFGPQTAYRGFFYSESDDLCAVWCAPSHDEVLTSHGDGYLWEEEVGDNRYYVEKICDNFYYYDASY